MRLPIYAVVMAGGQGTRFWPASRKRRPKQFLRVLGRRTMLQETLLRLRGISAPDRTFIVTAAEHAALARRQAPQVPPRNIVPEPVGRGTAPCIALAAELILAREPDAVMLVLPADHAVADSEGFRRVIRRAVEIATSANEPLVTIGIRPTYAETGYGYIETGRKIVSKKPNAYSARGFHEKPDSATARRYWHSGRFLWNSGIFVWRASVIRREIESHLPRTAAALRTIRRARSRQQMLRAVSRAYRLVDEISIDHGVMEKAKNVDVVAGDFGWNDVGSWAAMSDVWDSDDHRNATRGKVLAIASRRNIALAENRLVALLGVDDLIVIDTRDALLVCRRERAQDVRRIVTELRRLGSEELL